MTHTDPMTETTARNVVILGGGPAAHRLADALQARDTDRSLRVTVLSEEAHLPMTASPSAHGSRAPLT